MKEQLLTLLQFRPRPDVHAGQGEFGGRTNRCLAGLNPANRYLGARWKDLQSSWAQLNRMLRYHPEWPAARCQFRGSRTRSTSFVLPSLRLRSSDHDKHSRTGGQLRARRRRVRRTSPKRRPKLVFPTSCDTRTVGRHRDIGPRRCQARLCAGYRSDCATDHNESPS